MNPWGIVLIIGGLLMVVIGIHGSQHNTLAALKGKL
jgi:hypothetical protein